MVGLLAPWNLQLLLSNKFYATMKSLIEVTQKEYVGCKYLVFRAMLEDMKRRSTTLTN
jgi:hypothetical protein